MNGKDIDFYVKEIEKKKQFLEEQAMRDEQLMQQTARRIEDRNREIRMLDAKIIELSQGSLL